jgi:hypothetical protein
MRKSCGVNWRRLLHTAVVSPLRVWLRGVAVPAARAASADQNRAIREWAIGKGYEVAPRGRIKQEIIDEFHKRAGR